MKINKHFQKLKQRILDISYKHQLSHIGSCITAMEIIYEIYLEMSENDIFVLSSGHAGLALYVILEEIYGLDAEILLEKHGIHPNRNLNDKIFCSGGSLGLGITLGVGMAIASPNKKVYILISDGEQFEGSCLESLRFIRDYELQNCIVYCNCNGYSAYKKLNLNTIKNDLRQLMPSIQSRETNSDLSFCNGLSSHYQVMTEQDYKNETRI